MAESRLTLKKEDLDAAVGYELGLGRGALFNQTAWSSDDEFEIQLVVKSGLRQFYFPPKLPGESTAYEWTFLRPHIILTYVEAADPSTVLLPDDYQGIEGRVQFAASSGGERGSIELVHDSVVRDLRLKFPTQTGHPEFAAVEAIRGPVAGGGTNQNRSSRYLLHLYPIADQNYVLQFQYAIVPDSLTTTFPYPYGGAVHSETILESCLAIAESRHHGKADLHWGLFMNRLAASVALDRQHRPQTMGYNDDRSYGVASAFGMRRFGRIGTVQIGGVDPG